VVGKLSNYLIISSHKSSEIFLIGDRCLFSYSNKSHIQR